MSIDQILMVNDNGALVCDILDDDDEGASLDTLVDDWILAESLDDKLHPYLDDTLWVLKGLNDMMIRLIEHFEDDDPHRAGLLEIYELGRGYVNTILVRLNGAEGEV